MVTLKQTLTAFALSVGLIAALSAAQAQDAAQSAPLHSFNTPTENLVTGGQPSQAELHALKRAGVRKVVNLRSPEEDLPFDENAAVDGFGLEYISFPIAGAADITSENARKLYEILQDDENLFLHCASGNRVGALLAIQAHENEGKSVDEALEFGRAAGLGSLEGKVKLILDDTR